MDYPVTLMHGLPPLPRSLNGYHDLMNSRSPHPQQSSQFLYQQSQPHSPHAIRSGSDLKYFRRISPGPIHQAPPPVPPPRPHHGHGHGHRHSRHSHSGSSSSNSSALMGLGHGHSSPDHHFSVNRTIHQHASEMKGSSSSPARSLSSSPHSPHNIDSGLGRSSADSFSSSNNEPRAFVRVVKSPHHLVAPTTNLDSQLNQLKKDMHQLRQMDMALLGHLLSIHQGIQDLRNVLMPPPQPAPSSASSTMYHRHGGHGHDLNMGFPMLISEKPRGRKSSSRRDRSNEEDEQSDSLSSIEFGDV
ncbi:unnamed protein product [Allacma fusca]|uniref:Uncharacterized protein n=1 Tax=Allacma fusca TaxID=39272 RepID=A0A8J2JFC6_9HEXA|nr:unnamed protein product [Allacma fusca]